MPRLTTKWPSIALLVLTEILALSLWFSATAVTPRLIAEHGLDPARASLFTSAVSVGFVIGTLTSALLGLADRVPPRMFFTAATAIAALCTATIPLIEPGHWSVVALRFLTGVCMAGIYPVGMKMASSWAKGDTGLLVGILVGALTIGSAAPHLLNSLLPSGFDWRYTLYGAATAALLSGVLIQFIGLGPGLGKAPPFEPSAVLQAWRNKPLRLANMGYFGHMWELYAMWGWIGLFLNASFTASGVERPALTAGVVTFAVIASGGLGSLMAGYWADRIGRTTVTIAAMAVSGACCLTVGFWFGGNPVALTVLCLIWGISVVADSAQFSSCVIELSDRSHIGTMVTVQTCIGFLLTLATIHLIPALVGSVGWHWAFASLAIGPALGVVAMARLRAHPEATRIANGHR